MISMLTSIWRGDCATRHFRLRLHNAFVAGLRDLVFHLNSLFTWFQTLSIASKSPDRIALPVFSKITRTIALPDAGKQIHKAMLTSV